MDPFRLIGPAYVSFSGGRTSAYMLRRVLDIGLDRDVHVLFANTGKEAPETLDFIDECASRWDCPIGWVERARGGGFVEVTHGTASRRGEPFDALIDERGYVPHPGAPYCSTELKARVMRDWMRSRGYDDWTAAIGIRSDERSRVAKLRGQRREGGDIALPLAEAGIDMGPINAFWSGQPFALGCHQYEGNCDLCFKKSGVKVASSVDRNPSRAAWWAAAEMRTGTRWRNDRPTYAAMGRAAVNQVRLPMVDDGGEPCELCS